MADVDPPLGQQILDVAQRQRVPDVHHDDQTDHFRRAVEISKRIAHGLKLPQPGAARKIGLTSPVHELMKMQRFVSLMVSNYEKRIKICNAHKSHVEGWRELSEVNWPKLETVLLNSKCTTDRR